MDIKSATELPSTREAVTLRTSDGLNLVAELAVPVANMPVSTLVMCHPLPTHGGFMDSHVYRKAANRLPALADLAVFRFNTRGTESPHGKSDGEFGDGVTEEADVRAALEFVRGRGLPNIWVVGWSFGTELALKYALDEPVEGVILLSPPLRRTTSEELARWANSDKRVIAIVPELDDYLQPDEARQKFAVVPHAQVIGVDGAKHLWVGESATKRVLDEIVKAVNPSAYPLPEVWNG
ncbi:MAG: alpha/beta hydrolase [Micrococcales bacterium]